MQSKQTFSILFWIEKSRINNGEASLYARITVSGKRAEIATHRKVPVHGQNFESQILSSKTPGPKELNNYLAIVDEGQKHLEWFSLAEEDHAALNFGPVGKDLPGCQRITRICTFNDIRANHLQDNTNIYGMFSCSIDCTIDYVD